jgi:hypothetical protein
MQGMSSLLLIRVPAKHKRDQHFLFKLVSDRISHCRTTYWKPPVRTNGVIGPFEFPSMVPGRSSCKAGTLTGADCEWFKFELVQTVLVELRGE